MFIEVLIYLDANDLEVLSTKLSHLQEKTDINISASKMQVLCNSATPNAQI